MKELYVLYHGIQCNKLFDILMVEITKIHVYIKQSELYAFF